MTLPEVCPRDGISSCKRKECHLYMVEWRTGDEQCIIGYSSTHKELSRSVPLEDNYAERTRIRFEGSSVEERKPWPDTDTAIGNRKHLEREVSEDPDKITGTIVAGPDNEMTAVIDNEEVVLSNKDTTVIGSRKTEVKDDKGQKKKRSLDEMMDLDLPENYEEEFWK